MSLCSVGVSKCTDVLENPEQGDGFGLEKRVLTIVRNVPNELDEMYRQMRGAALVS